MACPALALPCFSNEAPCKLPVQNAKHKKTRSEAQPDSTSHRVHAQCQPSEFSSSSTSRGCLARSRVTHVGAGPAKTVRSHTSETPGSSQPWPEPLSASPGVALLRLSPLYAPRPCWHQNHALLHALARFVSSTSRTASHALSVRLVRTTKHNSRPKAREFHPKCPSVSTLFQSHTITTTR